MTKLKENFFSDFPPVSTEEWIAKITADLKGVPFEKKMIWKTNEGFDVKPFYRREDIDELNNITSYPGEFPYFRGTKKDNNWKVRQNMVVTDFNASNLKARDLLNKGVTSLGFYIKDTDVKTENIHVLLKGINPETTELNFETCVRKAALLTQHISDFLVESNADLDKCVGSIDYDPLKKPLLRGIIDNNWIEAASAVLRAGKDLPYYRVLSVNACHLNNAGATISQESGYALAWGNELISNLQDAGFEVDEIAKKIKFNFGISANYFMEIAKFRSVRRLWAEIVAVYKPECRKDCTNNQPDGLCRCACKMMVHAQTSSWNQTIYDTNVNLLRSQTETMSAAIAGVDSITVEPFDKAYKRPDDFSERIARNQQLLLKEECHFDNVTDAAAGSYYIEVLTSSLAEAAWNLFLETEDKGGFYEMASKGEVQRAINASSASRKKAIATRREVLLGTNQFPNFSEKAGNVGIKMEEGARTIAPDSGSSNCGCENGEITKLDFSRGASEFETLRLATERSGKTPKVFMLTIGNQAMRLARSQFSCNFYACAGYQVIDNLGFDTVEDGIEAAIRAEAQIVVLCSSDDEYAEFAPAAFKALAGRAIFVVAGAPACLDDLKAQGIEHFISVKSNVLETLKTMNDKLGRGNTSPCRSFH